MTDDLISRMLKERFDDRQTPGLIPAVEALRGCLNASQAYIFDSVIDSFIRLIETKEMKETELKRQVEQLQKQLTFKGVPDDGC